MLQILKLSKSYMVPVASFANHGTSVQLLEVLHDILTWTRWYPTWNMAGDADSNKYDLFSDPTIEGHAANKRLVSNSFSATSLHELEGLVQDPLNRLLERMDDFAREGSKPMNFSDWFQWFAFDVIGQVTFSQQFGFLDQGKDLDGTLKSIHEMTRSGIVVAELPELKRIRQFSFFRLLPVIGNFSSKLNFLIVVR